MYLYRKPKNIVIDSSFWNWEYLTLRDIILNLLKAMLFHWRGPGSLYSTATPPFMTNSRGHIIGLSNEVSFDFLKIWNQLIYQKIVLNSFEDIQKISVFGCLHRGLAQQLRLPSLLNFGISMAINWVILKLDTFPSGFK